MKIVQTILAGNLGNCLFQYAFARAYAEAYDAELRVDTRMLGRLFGLHHPRPEHDEFPHRESHLVREWKGETNIRIRGMAQHQHNLDHYNLFKVRRWFTFTPEILKLVERVPSLPVVASLRLGDYTLACNPFVWISRASYVEACKVHGLDDTEMFFLDGDRHNFRILAVPVEKRWQDLTVEERETSLDYLPDFVLMQRAKVLLRSNSTFAWWAATLADPGQRVFSPDVAKVNPEHGIKDGHRQEQHVPFVEGNHPPMAGGWPFLSDLHLKP